MERIPKLSKYRHFLFDWDGTLFPTNELWDMVWKQYTIDEGKKIPDDLAKLREDLVCKCKSAPNYYVSIFDEYNKIIGVDQGGEYTCQKVDKISFDYLKNMNYKGGAEKLLLQLVRARSGRGIVTSTPREKVEFVKAKNENVRNAADLNYIFAEKILTADEVAERKPDPMGYLMGLKMVGADIAHENLLIFEDSVTGAQAGINAKKTHPNIDVCVIHDDAYADKHDELREMTPYFINSYTELLQNQ